MSDDVLSVEAAERLVIATLLGCRTGRRQAAAVARALVSAELCGQAGHGLRRLPAYAAQAARGKVDGFAEPVATQPRPAALAIDAAHGFAYPALELAEALLPAIARTEGVALAGIRRSHHAGVAGLAVERLAEAGLVALLLANTPAAIAPPGGRRALLGTNPVAFAAPLPDAPPLVVDLALSAVARGRVMAAAQAGEPIPEGWALDAAGRPTTDAAAALAGTMLALGGTKGAALALMVELLAAGLTGARFASDAGSFLDAEGPPPGTGQFLLVIDPEAVAPGSVARFGTLAALVAAEPGARLPGARRAALRAERRAAGIVVPATLRAAIDRAGDGAGDRAGDAAER